MAPSVSTRVASTDTFRSSWETPFVPPGIVKIIKRVLHFLIIVALVPRSRPRDYSREISIGLGANDGCKTTYFSISRTINQDRGSRLRWRDDRVARFNED